MSHFRNLLGKPRTLPAVDTLPKIQICDYLNIPINEFTINELTPVLNHLLNKALGPDKIPAILWKDPIFHRLLLDLCNFAYKNHISPSIWLQSQIIPIPKSGDLTLPTNYRGISLLSIAAKIYNKQGRGEGGGIGGWRFYWGLIVFMLCRFSVVLLCVFFIISKTGILSFYF